MIDVILRQDVPSLGKTGQMVRVKPGYARNFLFPHQLAFEATEGNRKRIESETRARDSRAAGERQEAEVLSARLAAATVTLTAKAGEDGKLFGSITSSDIAEALEAQGIVIDRRRIELEHPLKHLGSHSVPVRLHHDVHGEVRVNVVSGS